MQVLPEGMMKSIHRCCIGVYECFWESWSKCHPNGQFYRVDLRCMERASIEAPQVPIILCISFEAIHQVVFAGNVETLKRMVDSGANPGCWLCIFLVLDSLRIILAYSCHNHELQWAKSLRGEVSRKVWRGINKRSVQVFQCCSSKCVRAKLGFLPLGSAGDFCY